MKYPEYTNPLRKRANYWCPGFGKKGNWEELLHRHFLLGWGKSSEIRQCDGCIILWMYLLRRNRILKWWILCFMHLMHTRELVLLNYVPALPPAPCLVRMPAGVDFWLWPMAWASWTLSPRLPNVSVSFKCQILSLALAPAHSHYPNIQSRERGHHFSITLLLNEPGL